MCCAFLHPKAVSWAVLRPLQELLWTGLFSFWVLACQHTQTHTHTKTNNKTPANMFMTYFLLEQRAVNASISCILFCSTRSGCASHSLPVWCVEGCRHQNASAAHGHPPDASWVFFVCDFIKTLWCRTTEPDQPKKSLFDPYSRFEAAFHCFWAVRVDVASTADTTEAVYSSFEGKEPLGGMWQQLRGSYLFSWLLRTVLLTICGKIKKLTHSHFCVSSCRKIYIYVCNSKPSCVLQIHGKPFAFLCLSHAAICKSQWPRKQLWGYSLSREEHCAAGTH